MDAAGVEFKASLRTTALPIWRTLRVPGWLTMTQLHEVMQLAFEWSDAHPHEWMLGRVRVRPKTLKLRDLGLVRGATLLYRYDLGDRWEVELKVLRLLDEVAAVECVAGELAGPPEDCGGPSGYFDVLHALAQHTEETRELRERVERLKGPEWLAGDFDRRGLNRALAKFKSRGVVPKPKPKPKRRRRPHLRLVK